MASKVVDGTYYKECGNCGASDTPLRACGQCRAVHYCSRDCQAQHWRATPGHRRFCTPWSDKGHCTLKALIVENGHPICLICRECLTIDASCMFPCGHIFHFACAESLIGAGTAQLPHAGATKCPHCRKAVSLHDLHLLDGGAFLYAVTAISVKAGACRWDALEGMERANMDKALEMWGVAANIRQCPIAHKYLGDVFFRDTVSSRTRPRGSPGQQRLRSWA
jgi:hypothetical protein